MEELARELYECLKYYDPYEASNCDASVEACKRDIEENPTVVIKGLIDMCNNLMDNIYTEGEK